MADSMGEVFTAIVKGSQKRGNGAKVKKSNITTILQLPNAVLVHALTLTEILGRHNNSSLPL